MSLFGAMNAGVAGLAAQSSAMAAISDNITNVNTVGYKGSKVDFQTLVTKQASKSLYSSGGVQSRPHAAVDVQGLLQPSESATDLAISGDGFFLVNEASQPRSGDEFLYTRAGSFSQDPQGYLRNAAGFYLQAWPTDADGKIVLPPTSTADTTNKEVISPDFLETVNLNRVGGTAEATTRIAMGANLPADAEVGDAFNIDVQFYNTLGKTNAMSFTFDKAGTNSWNLTAAPPKDVSVLTLFDSAGKVYKSNGQLEFTAQPKDTAKLEINGVTYEFDGVIQPDGTIVSNGVTGANTAVAIGTSISQTIQNLITAVQAAGASSGPPVVLAPFGLNTRNGHSIAQKPNTLTVLLTGGSGEPSFTIDPTGLVDANGKPATRQGLLPNPAFEVLQQQNTGKAINFTGEGLPSTFNVASMSVVGFVDGSTSMNNTDITGDEIADVPRVALDFGSENRILSITQFQQDFTPGVVEQNGAEFGVCMGVTVSDDGLMSALFENGERRPIYRLPLATFVNPDGLKALSGNIWIPTEESGNSMLRTADSGSAGAIVQSSLEASTVDIGQEFTNMIVVQRAYSAATRIISTADEMLEELVRVKR